MSGLAPIVGHHADGILTLKLEEAEPMMVVAGSGGGGVEG